MKEFMEDLKVAVNELLDELFLVIGGDHYEQYQGNVGRSKEISYRS